MDIAALASQAVDSIQASMPKEEAPQYPVQQEQPVTYKKDTKYFDMRRPENYAFLRQLRAQSESAGAAKNIDPQVFTTSYGVTAIVPGYLYRGERTLDPDLEDDAAVLETRADHLLKLGYITRYSSEEEAHEDLAVFNEAFKDDGFEQVQKFEEGGLVTPEMKIANILGIKSEDIQWADTLGQHFGGVEELDGRGDAARHLALGWLAAQSKNPEIARKAINAREYISTDFNSKARDMDIKNNSTGYQLKATNKEEAQAEILDLIENKKAVFMSLDESKKTRGYEEGGVVEPQKLEPGVYQDDAGNLFKVTADGTIDYVRLGGTRA